MEKNKIEIKVYPVEKDSKDYICFKLNDGDKLIDLGSDDQTNLRELFASLIEIGLSNQIQLKYVDVETYNKDLFKNVASEYTKQLQTELDRVIALYPEELKIKKSK